VRLSGRYVGQNIGAEGIIGYLYVFVAGLFFRIQPRSRIIVRTVFVVIVVYTAFKSCWFRNSKIEIKLPLSKWVKLKLELNYRLVSG